MWYLLSSISITLSNSGFLKINVTFHTYAISFFLSSIVSKCKVLQKKKGQILVSLEVAWLHQKTFRKDRKNVNKNIFISFAFSLLSKESCEFEDHSVIFPFPCVLLKTVRICERPVRSFETKSKKNFFIYHFWDNTGIRFFKFRKLFSMSLPADPAAMAVSS